MDVLDRAELRLTARHEVFRAVVEVEVVGERGLPLVARVRLKARWEEDETTVVAYLSLAGRVVGLLPLPALEREAELLLLTAAREVLDGELLFRVRTWLQAGRGDVEGDPCDVVERGRRLVEALGRAAQREDERAHRAQLRLMELLRESFQLFEGVRERSEAWRVRNSDPLGSMVAAAGRSAGPPPLRSVGEEALAEALVAAEDEVVAADADEQLDRLAVAAWRRMSDLVLARTEAMAHAEEVVVEQSLDAYALVLGHMVGGTVLGAPRG